MILYVRFHSFSLSYGSGVAAYWAIAAHSAYDMFSQYKYLTVNLVFSCLGFVGVGISF